MNRYVCEHCRGTAIRTANAALALLSDRGAPNTTLSIAVEELDRAVGLLHLNAAQLVHGDNDPNKVTP
jgi:hypothetical protein